MKSIINRIENATETRLDIYYALCQIYKDLMIDAAEQDINNPLYDENWDGFNKHVLYQELVNLMIENEALNYKTERILEEVFPEIVLFIQNTEAA